MVRGLAQNQPYKKGLVLVFLYFLRSNAVVDNLTSTYYSLHQSGATLFSIRTSPASSWGVIPLR